MTRGEMQRHGLNILITVILVFNLISTFDITKKSENDPSFFKPIPNTESMVPRGDPGTIVFEKIIENTTWTKENSPYYIIDFIGIKNNSTLTIEPGTVIIFYPHSSLGFGRPDSIVLNGTQSNRIFLFSYSKDLSGNISPGTLNYNYCDFFNMNFLFRGTSNILFYRCNFYSCKGIVMDEDPDLDCIPGPRNNSVIECNFINNTDPLIIQSAGNKAFFNNFINCTYNKKIGWPQSSNTWNDTAGHGNHWSDYNGTDENEDGIGDTNLPWHDVDYYPLINPSDSIDYCDTNWSERIEPFLPEDLDWDGMPNNWEIDHGLNPNDSSDANEDPDNDGETNLEEYVKGTDPNVPENDAQINVPIYWAHEPIRIVGHENFTLENGVSSGRGTPNDPYIIKDWVINASNQAGIEIRNVSKYFVIKNCCIHSGNNVSDGIVFINVTNGCIENNTIIKNRFGIIFGSQMDGKENSDNNIIQYNSIIFNTYDGIHFTHLGGAHHSENVVLYNNISYNGRGIYMITSSDNLIKYNNISRNDGLAILLERCIGGGENNIIHHNNIIGNLDENGQAGDFGGKNYWNDTYPSGGNYWSNYSGNDTFSGVNQDEPESDGIGDTPYNISDGRYNRDEYPLMIPVDIHVVWPLIPPAINFSYDPHILIAMKNVRFSDTSSDFDGSIESWFWNFGDGNTSAFQNPIHQYSDEGIYAVQLVVTDNDGLSVKLTREIEVVNVTPMADFSYLPIDPTDMDEIQFLDTSVDPDANDTNSIVNWTWNFGDENISYDQNPVHLFNDDGEYNVTLAVRDNEGWGNNTTKSIAVLNVPPIINISFTPIHPDIDEIVEFNSTGSIDPDGTIVSWNWSFGDGNTSHQQNPSHVYSVPGTYFVSLNITDDDGDFGKAEMAISVARESPNNTPIVEIIANPTHGVSPLNVSFEGILNNTNGNMDVQYFWNFGDGNTSLESNPIHVFVSPGNYTVTLSIIVDNGITVTDSIVIMVESEINPFPDADSDNDTYNDTYELEQGSDPYDPLSTPIDWDGDGWNNSVESQVGTNPLSNLSVPRDSDADGIPDSLDPDRDGDGVANVDDAYPDDRERWEGSENMKGGNSGMWWLVGVGILVLVLGIVLGVVLVTKRRERIGEEDNLDCVEEELGRVGREE